MIQIVLLDQLFCVKQEQAREQQKRPIRQRTKTNNNDAPPPPHCAIRATQTRALYSEMHAYQSSEQRARDYIVGAVRLRTNTTIKRKPHKNKSDNAQRTNEPRSWARGTALATRQEQENKSHHTNVVSRCRPTERHETTTRVGSLNNEQTNSGTDRRLHNDNAWNNLTTQNSLTHWRNIARTKEKYIITLCVLSSLAHAHTHSRSIWFLFFRLLALSCSDAVRVL